MVREVEMNEWKGFGYRIGRGEKKKEKADKGKVKMYNIEIWNNSICIRTLYVNGSYALCVFKKREMVSNGSIERRIRIVEVR